MEYYDIKQMREVLEREIDALCGEFLINGSGHFACGGGDICGDVEASLS